MSAWWLNWLGNKASLTAEQQHRLDTWKSLPRIALDKPFNATRYVVVDVETSGLNLMQDHLISIGAVAVVNGQIALGESFYMVLQQETVSHKENILLHGIGGGAQTGGVPAADALLAFLEYLGKDPLIAFHVTFDQTMIQRAIHQYLGVSFGHAWADMAYLMPAIYPSYASRYRLLDDWITHFNIHNDARHNALSDAMVTAQLFQIALSLVSKKKIADFAGLRDLEKMQRWVSGIS
ncbi:MAG: 3'-5' exonuclease [Gallionella sp.]|nr:3'-5' exonuclease [Gallionella sp.]